MELADYLRVLRRRWWLIVLAIVVCATAAGAASWSRTPVYTATTRLSVVAGDSENAVVAIANRQQANTNATAYAQYVSTGPALAAAVDKAGAQAAGARATAFADGSNSFIVITVTARSARAAQNVANAYVTVLPTVVTTLEQTSDSAAPKLSTLEAALLPTRPTSPNHPRDLIVGLVIGLALGVAGALVREALDARVRDSAEIEKITGATLLGSIPKENNTEVLVSITRPRSGRAEAYRHVRTNLEFTGPEGMPRSLVVTSAAPGEGKSSLSANLAVVAARSGRNVVLVDADLRKPSMAKYFGVQSSVGLADVLSGRWAWQECLVPVEGERIHVLTSGPIPRFPSELVGSAAMTNLIEELEQNFDLVIIDTPPVLPVSDALVIGVNVGGVVVVGRMVETKRAALKRAVEAVRKVNGNLLGVVGNAVVKQEEKAYGEGYGYAYGYISNAPQDQQAPPSIRPAARRDEASRRGRHATPADLATSPDAAIPLHWGSAGVSEPEQRPLPPALQWLDAQGHVQSTPPSAGPPHFPPAGPADGARAFPQMAAPPPGGLASPPVGVPRAQAAPDWLNNAFGHPQDPSPWPLGDREHPGRPPR